MGETGGKKEKEGSDRQAGGHAAEASFLLLLSMSHVSISSFWFHSLSSHNNVYMSLISNKMILCINHNDPNHHNIYTYIIY